MCQSMQYRSDKQSKSVSPCDSHVQLFQHTKKCEHKQIGLLTYSIYFPYAILLTDYKKILKIAGEVKQLTVSLLPIRTVPCPRTMRSASFLSSAPVVDLWLCACI